MLLDEPTAALDEASIQAAEDLLREHLGQGLSLLWVTHSRPQAARMGDRCLYLHNGQLAPMDAAQNAAL